MKGRVEDNVATRRSSGEKGRIIFWLYICSSVFIERLNTQMMVIQKVREKKQAITQSISAKAYKRKTTFSLTRRNPSTSAECEKYALIGIYNGAGLRKLSEYRRNVFICHGDEK